MKATGIVRSIDELGRICLPKEPRVFLGITDGSYVEIHLNESEDGIVITPSNATNKKDLDRNGIFRKMDILGRVVIPPSIRQILKIEQKTPLQVFTDNDTILLKEYSPGCIFTGEIKGVIEYKGHKVSIEAIHELAKMANII